jgi:hypothetical protein
MSAFPLAGEVLATKFTVSLDWSDPIHWDDDEFADCRSCGTPTKSRDAERRPIHQSCALRLVAEQVGQRGGRIVDERFPMPAQQLAPHEHTEVTR